MTALLDLLFAPARAADPLTPDDQRVLALFADGARHCTKAVATATGWPLSKVTDALRDLERRGLLVQVGASLEARWWKRGSA